MSEITCVWIDSNKAVPSDDRKVLVRTYLEWKVSNGKIRSSVNYYLSHRISYKNGKVKWKDSRGGLIVTPESQTRITHWMDIPEYKEPPCAQ